MNEFLRQYAVSIQALASIVMMLATVTLVVITARYVKLTKDLADVAKQELQYLRQERTAKINQVLTLIKMFRAHLKSLPTDVQHAEQIRIATLWDPKDVTELQRLAADLDYDAAAAAAQLAAPLGYLHDRVNEVKNTSATLGVEWRKFDWTKWLTTLHKAEGHLKEIWSRALQTERV